MDNGDQWQDELMAAFAADMKMAVDLTQDPDGQTGLTAIENALVKLAHYSLVKAADRFRGTNRGDQYLAAAKRLEPLT